MSQDRTREEIRLLARRDQAEEGVRDACRKLGKTRAETNAVLLGAMEEAKRRWMAGMPERLRKLKKAADEACTGIEPRDSHRIRGADESED